MTKPKEHIYITVERVEILSEKLNRLQMPWFHSVLEKSQSGKQRQSKRQRLVKKRC
jgi:hypothetical protein